MIQSVLFDLDGTLKINVPSGLDAFVNYAREQGIPLDEPAIRAGERWNHWYWARSAALAEDLAQGEELDFWVRYSVRLLQALQVAEVDPLVAANITQRFAAYSPKACLNDGAHETLTALRAAGYTLGLVSNRSTPLQQAVSDLGLDGCFAFTLAAGEVSMWKPDPGILTEAIRRSNGQPETSIYVGDNYYADVISARAAGMVPVLLDPRAIFPEADCRVIGRLPELVDWLAPQAAPDPSVRGEMPPAR